jgi:hypothetical protein
MFATRKESLFSYQVEEKKQWRGLACAVRLQLKENK